MELLATVHWVGTQETNPVQDSEQAIELVYSWSDGLRPIVDERKRTILKPRHIRKAWQRLEQQNWLAAK